MHRHQGMLRARAELVDGLGDHFLARPAFPQQQHGRPRGRHLLHHLENLFHARGLPDQVLQAEPRVELLAQGRVFRFEPLPPQRVGDPHLQLVQLQPPLGNVIVGPMLHRLHGQFLRPISGHQDADGRPGQRLGAHNQLHPVFGRQPEISQQHVKMLRLQ